MEAKLFVVSLYAEDVTAAVHFYQQVIGLKLAAHHDDRPHFKVGGGYLVLLKGKLATQPSEGTALYPLVALLVDDFEAALERLRQHGVDLPGGVEQAGSLRWAMFHDPAGNLIELVQKLC